VSSDGTNFAKYGVNGNVAKIVGPTSGAIYLQANTGASDYIVVSAASVAPSGSGAITLGLPSLPWGDSYILNSTSSTSQRYMPIPWLPTEFSAQSGSYVTNIYATNMAAGITDLFTPPTGKKAVMFSGTRSTTNATITTGYWMVKTNGNYYFVSPGSTVLTNLNALPALRYVFDEHSTLVSSNDVIGMNLGITLLVIPSSSVLMNYTLFPLPAGQSTLFTIPNGFHGVFPNYPGGVVSAFAEYVNNTGSSRVISTYYLPPGGSVGLGTRMLSKSVTNKSATDTNVPVWIPAGASFVIETDGSGADESAYFNLALIPD
jgi:hypothetical protein